MKKGLLLWLLLAMGVVHSYAQTRTITGSVRDAQDGQQLPGVSVVIKGTKTGVVSGADGKFSITVSAADALLFSFVGYETKEEKVGNRSSINVSLTGSNKVLNEVLVTGYGELKRKDVTSSVSHVSSSLINDRPATSFDQALTGRAAGVNIATNSGVLGDAVSIRIRGVNSITNSTQPLVIVDGIPMNTLNNANVFNSGNGTRYNPLADINPNDIESIDVLKDAAASALYGSRAAAGVIIITTKRGKTGTVNVNYNGYVGTSTAAKLPKLLNGDDFTTIQNEKAKNATKTGGTAAILAKDIDVNGDGKPDRTDWLKEVFRTGIIHNHQLGLTGGTEKAKFYASGEYADQQGMIVSNRLRRGAIRMNLDVTPKKWLKSGLTVYSSKSLNNGVLSDGYLGGSTFSAFNAMPNVPVYDKAGNLYIKNPPGNGDLADGNNITTNKLNRFFHPLSNLLLGRNDNTSTRVLSNAYIEVEPIKDLKFTSRFGVDMMQNFEDQYSGPLQAGLGLGNNGLVQENLLRQNLWNWSNYINYSKSFNNVHFINVTLGQESQHTEQKQLYTGQGNLADSYFKEIYDGLFAGSDNSYTGGGRFANSFESYFGKVGYNYGSKYYFDATLRADAYSDFGTNNRRGYFPGVSVGWRISEERFFKENISFINDVKFRASYGMVGNSNIRSYAFRSLYGGGQYGDVNGFGVAQIGDPNLQWEKSKKLDIGIDVSLLKNRISFVADYFKSNIDHLILDAPILATVGTPWDPTGVVGSILTTNIGSMWNKGVELTFNTQNIVTRDFTWTSSLNFTYIKNRVTATADGSDIIKTNNRVSVGKSMGVFKLIKWGGVNPDNGNPMYYNAKGELVMYNVDPNVPTAQKWTSPDGSKQMSPVTGSDAQYLDKSGYPTWFGGFNNTFSYKGIDLSIMLQYSGGNYVYNATRAALMSNYFQNNLEEIKNRWTPENKNTDVPKIVLSDAPTNQASTRWLEKGDFLRAREISLGYTFPGIKEKIGLNSLRLYGLVQNAFMITKYKGADPEINTNRDSNINYGTDNRGMSLPRIFMLGLNVGF
ncbi:SusC/RagA family TonB-linked outer membrane protein [Chitinophaga arvensicola]|uniref:TonB-linked outer membrane protein, SusC/RagA family n=1 Tax=Chitinophaga arvensicola TaxID=29529 RepID=A0A1I0SBG4_9BACT|nr:TonB-dependent receptor [Chitinophaga arvensicola]SEW53903.1 TonB-linked outer membrane protein, SusC/RagA family [Chitinophaga arvensicola]